MRLEDLIKTNSWLSIRLVLLDLYPDQVSNINTYETIFDDLQKRQAVDNDIEIVLTRYLSDETNEVSYVDVSGRRLIDQKDSITEGLAIEFVPWDKWLGMTISETTLRDFTELEIISHCLYEMTFIDFDEEAIQEQLENLNDTIKEYKSMSEEEKRNATTSLEDFLDELKNDDGSDS